MKATIVIASLVGIVVVIAAIFWSRSQEPDNGTFWDVVRNPDALPDLNQLHQQADESAKALAGSEQGIAKLVHSFVFDAASSDDAWNEKQVIARLGSDAYPAAIKILKDPTLQDKLTALVHRENSLPEAPINRLCEIFDLNAPPPPEAAEALAPYLKSESDQIRKSAALVIGSVGDSKSIPDLTRTLRDQDEYVRSFALMGIQRAMNGNRIDAGEKEAYFEMVAGMWPADTSFGVSDSIPHLLLKLDRARAINLLLSPELLTTEFEPVWRILEACEAELVLIPRAKLLSLIEQAGQEPIKFPMENVLEGALTLLGQHRNEEDLPVLERWLNHSDENVVRGAISGLTNYHRLNESIRDPWEIYENEDWDSLTQAEKHLVAIEILDAEVNNGGFAQYYFNSSGDHWQDALSGLAAIGAIKRHKLMAATIAKFDKTPPSSDRDTRSTQLSEMVTKQEDPFHDQDSVWYKTPEENVELLSFRYSLMHQEGRKKEQAK